MVFPAAGGNGMQGGELASPDARSGKEKRVRGRHWFSSWPARRPTDLRPALLGRLQT